MHVSARSDYAVRAVVELARTTDALKCPVIARNQDIPLKFLVNILGDLRRAGIVRSRRGAGGGYWLARPAHEVTLGQVLRAIDGPLTTVAGTLPDELVAAPGEGRLVETWRRLAKVLDEVVDGTTMADVATDGMPLPTAAPERGLP